MKVLLVNGSPRANSNAFLGLKEMQKIFEEQEIETEIFNIGNKDIRGCIACGRCGEVGQCVFDDVVNEFAKKFEAADCLKPILEQYTRWCPRRSNRRRRGNASPARTRP